MQAHVKCHPVHSGGPVAMTLFPSSYLLLLSRCFLLPVDPWLARTAVCNLSHTPVKVRFGHCEVITRICPVLCPHYKPLIVSRYGQSPCYTCMTSPETYSIRNSNVLHWKQCERCQSCPGLYCKG